MKKLSYRLTFLLAGVLLSPVAGFGQQEATTQTVAPLVITDGQGQPTGSKEFFEQNSTGDQTCETAGFAQKCCCDQGLFGLGFIKRSDHCFDDFISPMTNPVFFEDPRALTEARAIFLRHKVPLAAGGGNVQLFALQLRARLSENVSFIATKDGYFTSNNALIGDGWADTAFGFKFNLLRDVQNKRLLSSGFTFEMPTGEASAFQGNGHGELNFFLTGARKLARCVNMIAAGGLRVPLNNTDESMSSYFSTHIDYQFRRRAYLFTELNWFHWLEAGTVGTLNGVEGLDAFNFGSTGVAGNDIVTMAQGLKIKPRRNQELGVAFEFPLTERRDVLDNRVTVDWIVRY